MKPIVGSIVALVTPMQEDGSVDYAALRKLIDWHIAEGTDCIGVVGTTGDAYSTEYATVMRRSLDTTAALQSALAQGSVAASSSLRWAGVATSASAASTCTA